MFLTMLLPDLLCECDMALLAVLDDPLEVEVLGDVDAELLLAVRVRGLGQVAAVLLPVSVLVMTSGLVVVA